MVHWSNRILLKRRLAQSVSEGFDENMSRQGSISGDAIVLSGQLRKLSFAQADAVVETKKLAFAE